MPTIHDKTIIKVSRACYDEIRGELIKLGSVGEHEIAHPTLHRLGLDYIVIETPKGEPNEI